MKWVRSFLLHPWLNRFNLAFLTLGLVGVIATGPDVPVGWATLGVEAAYLVVRGVLDRSRSRLFQIRRLPARERNRYFRLWETCRRVEGDLAQNKHQVGAMAADAGQLKRLLVTCLDLLLAAQRIDQYALSRSHNFDAAIADATAGLEQATEKEKEILAGNVEVLRKRREAFRDLTERRRMIDHRLSTLENAIELLGEVGVGLNQPAEAADQVKVILANVEDAESFMSELNQVIPPIRVKS